MLYGFEVVQVDAPFIQTGICITKSSHNFTSFMPCFLAYMSPMAVWGMVYVQDLYYNWVKKRKKENGTLR